MRIHQFGNQIDYNNNHSGARANQESTLVSTPHIHKQSQLEQKLKLHPHRLFSPSDENMGFVYNSS